MTIQQLLRYAYSQGWRAGLAYGTCRSKKMKEESWERDQAEIMEQLKKVDGSGLHN